MKLSAYLSIALLAAGMSATVSCSQENEPDLTASSVQGLTISISDSGYATTDGTRAIDQAYKTTFTDGDAIGVFAVRSGKVVEKISNRKFTFKEGNWELEGDPIEYKGTEFKYMKFFAYYPYSEDVKFDAGKWDAATQTGDPFESYVNTWNIQSDQSGDNYTKQDLMTSSSDAEGERLQGKVAFTMTHRMSLVVLEMPKLTYDFTNPGLDDYQMNVSPADFQINGKAAHPHYDAATHTYLALVNPGKDFTIGGSYTGTQLMEYSAKGNLQGGNAKKYTIKDAGKIIQRGIVLGRAHYIRYGRPDKPVYPLRVIRIKGILVEICRGRILSCVLFAEADHRGSTHKHAVPVPVLLVLLQFQPVPHIRILRSHGQRQIPVPVSRSDLVPV